MQVRFKKVRGSFWTFQWNFSFWGGESSSCIGNDFWLGRWVEELVGQSCVEWTKKTEISRKPKKIDEINHEPSHALADLYETVGKHKKLELKKTGSTVNVKLQNSRSKCSYREGRCSMDHTSSNDVPPLISKRRSLQLSLQRIFEKAASKMPSRVLYYQSKLLARHQLSSE